MNKAQKQTRFEILTELRDLNEKCKVLSEEIESDEQATAFATADVKITDAITAIESTIIAGDGNTR